MATASQVAANRENAKRPRTLSEETKESLRTRALKHGLTSKRDSAAVLKGEDKEEFETILNALLSEATLGTAQEILLIQMQAESFWKSQRAGRMEAGAMDVSVTTSQLMGEVPQQATEEEFGAVLAVAYREQSVWFDKIRRYSTTAERTFFRATRELAMIRKAGPKQEIGYVPQNAKLEETKEQTVEQAKKPAPEIGCDSQKPPIHHPGTQEFLGDLDITSGEKAFAMLDKLTAPSTSR